MDLYGVFQQLPIKYYSLRLSVKDHIENNTKYRLKEGGTLMEKDQAFGTLLLILEVISITMKLVISVVIATTITRQTFSF